MEPSGVLFVDDEDRVLSALRRALAEEDGITCHFAGSGDEALALLDTISCKVVVSDVKMVGMNGLELLTRVKERHPGVTRVVLSGHADIKLVLDSVNRGGIDRYLTKPWEDEEVIATIHQCIELFDLRQERDRLKKELEECKRASAAR